MPELQLEPRSATRGWTIAAGAAGLALWILAVVLTVARPGLASPESLWFPRGFNLPLAAVLLGMGWLLASRRPDNPVSWSLFVAGVLGCAQSSVVELAILAHDRGWPEVGAWASLGVEILWPGIIVGMGYAIGAFPGNAARPGHRYLKIAATTTWVALIASEVLVAGPFQNIEWYDNPIALVSAEAGETVESVIFLPLIALFATAMYLFVTGYRRSHGRERQQFKWVAAMGVPFVLSMMSLPLTVDTRNASSSDPGVVLSTVTMSLVPIGMAVAVIRYRLYDLDRILSRTVAWAILTALVIVLWGAVALLPSTLVGDGEASPVLVAGATVLAAAAFNPLRIRLQDAVDRRLHRKRYDAVREVEALGGRLSDAVTATVVTEQVLLSLERTVAPRTAAVWLPGEGTSA